MAKQSGLGDRLFYNGVDVSGDVSALDSIATPKASFDVTSIQSSAMERITGRTDGKLSFSSFFNDGGAADRTGAAGSTFATLSALPTSDVAVMYCRGTATGNPMAFVIGKQMDYPVTLGADGSLTFKTDVEASAGTTVEWGTQITGGKVTHASAGSSVGEVSAAKTTYGGVGFLQFFSKASGTPTFVLEDSADTTNGSDGTWGTLLTFSGTGGATPFGERKTVSGDVEKGVRATTTGTFTNAVFAIGLRRGTQHDEVAL